MNQTLRYECTVCDEKDRRIAALEAELQPRELSTNHAAVKYLPCATRTRGCGMRY